VNTAAISLKRGKNILSTGKQFIKNIIKIEITCKNSNDIGDQDSGSTVDVHLICIFLCTAILTPY
jgi:hypothetical protein